MNKEKLLTRVDQLIELGESAKIKDSEEPRMDVVIFHQFRTECYSFIELIYGTSHLIYKNFLEITEFQYYDNLENAFGVLKAIRSNIDGGWLATQRGLLAAEIFEDIFSMAEHLIDEGYKDPGAVIIGSLLEQHIKEVCRNHSIDINEKKGVKLISKKAETLNVELCKKGVYSLTDQKQVTAWLGLRNDSAHGNYSKYTIDQVKLMYQGVTNFTTRIS